MKFSIDFQDPYLLALRAVLRRQRRFKRQGKIYLGIKAPTDRERKRKVVIWVAERRNVYRVLTTDRRHFGAIRVGPRLARPLELLP